MADLGVSSLDVMDAILAFEDVFGVEIPDSMIMQIKDGGGCCGVSERAVIVMRRLKHWRF